MHRAARAAWPALTFLVAIVSALVVTAALAGGADGIVVARAIVLLVLDLATATVLGVLTAVLVVLPADDGRRGRLLDLAAGAAAVWAVAAATTTVLLYLGEGPSASDPAFGPGLVSFAADVAVGRTWLVAAIAAAVLTAALVAARSQTGLVLVAAAAVLAVVPEALQGPKAADPLAIAHTIAAADFVQLVCTGAWTGVVAVCVGLGAPAEALRRAAGFSVGFGLAAVVAAVLRAPVELADGVAPAVVALPVVVLIVLVVVAVLARRRAAEPCIRVVLLLLGGLTGFTAGVAVVGRVSSLPAARTSPAEILTGSPLPAPMTPARLISGWQPDAFWLVICAALLLGHLGGVAAARRRGATWPVARTGSWVVGVLALGWLTSGGPAVYQTVLLSAHLAQHAALLLPVPLLLALGAPMRLLRLLRAPRDGAGSVREGLLATAGSSTVGWIARPVPAAGLAAVVLTTLYGTGVLGWSLADPVGTDVAAALCLVAGGVLVAAFTSDVAGRRVAVAAAAVLLVLEVAGGAALVLGSGLLLASWYGAMGWGTDALADQRTGAVVAAVLLIVPTVVLLVAAARKAPVPLRPARPIIRDQEEVPA